MLLRHILTKTHIHKLFKLKFLHHFIGTFQVTLLRGGKSTHPNLLMEGNRLIQKNPLFQLPMNFERGFELKLVLKYINRVQEQNACLDKS